MSLCARSGDGGERARSFGEKENAGAYCLGVSGIYPSFLSDGDGEPRGVPSQTVTGVSPASARNFMSVIEVTA